MADETSCRACRATLPWYVAGYLSALQQDRMQRHLEHCVACQREFTQWQAIARVTRTQAQRFEVTPSYSTSWQKLQARIETHGGTTSSRSTYRSRSPYRIAVGASIAASLLFACVVVVGSTYASVLPILTRILNIEPGTRQVLQTNLYQNIHQSQTLQGFTLTLEKAYADSNRVIVGYTITSPPGHQYAPMLTNALITTAEGLSLPPLGTLGTFDKNLGATAAPFDASGIVGSPKVLHLHFTIGGFYVDERNVITKDGNDASFTLKGPLAFDFIVPFHPGRSITPRQHLTVAGKTVTLERVVVTLSETRVYMQGLDRHERLSAQLFVGDQQASSPLKVTEISLRPDRSLLLSFPYSLSDKHGIWTLTVEQVSRTTSKKDGLWVFHFTLP